MPDGALNEVNIKIATVILFLVMKGMCMWDRQKEKDAYDIYFTILHYPGSINELVKIFQPFKSNRLVQEGLGKIKAKFKDIDTQDAINYVSLLSTMKKSILPKIESHILEPKVINRKVK